VSRVWQLVNWRDVTEDDILFFFEVVVCAEACLDPRVNLVDRQSSKVVHSCWACSCNPLYSLVIAQHCIWRAVAVLLCVKSTMNESLLSWSGSAVLWELIFSTYPRKCSSTCYNRLMICYIWTKTKRWCYLGMMFISTPFYGHLRFNTASNPSYHRSVGGSFQVERDRG
jgi:hypothetical protein